MRADNSQCMYTLTLERCTLTQVGPAERPSYASCRLAGLDERAR